MVGIDDGKNILEGGERDGLMDPGGWDQGSEGWRDKYQWGFIRGKPHQPIYPSGGYQHTSQHRGDIIQGSTP